MIYTVFSALLSQCSINLGYKPLYLNHLYLSFQQYKRISKQVSQHKMYYYTGSSRRRIFRDAFSFFILSRQKMKGSGYPNVLEEVSGAKILLSSPCSGTWQQVAMKKYFDFPF